MAFGTVKYIFTKYPIVKGMLAYSITWPAGNIIQQTMDGKRWGNFNLANLFQFHYNSLIMIDLDIIYHIHLQIHTTGKNVPYFHCTVQYTLHHHCMVGLN